MLIESVELFPKQTKKFTYLVPVAEKGVYQVIARLNPDELSLRFMCANQPEICGKHKYFVSDIVEIFQ